MRVIGGNHKQTNVQGGGRYIIQVEGNAVMSYCAYMTYENDIMSYHGVEKHGAGASATIYVLV